MVQPDSQERQPGAQPVAPRLLPAKFKALTWARDQFEGSLAQSFLVRLKVLDFADQAMLFGAGLLVSLLPFVILLSAFASQRVDDDIALRLGLDHRAAVIVDGLFTSATATLNAATATSLVFLTAGMLTVAGSLQQIYEKAFRQGHRGIRDLGRLLTWIVVLCLTVVLESLAERPVSKAGAGSWLAPLVTAAIVAPFFWWTMHFLLAGRVRWRTLAPSAVITAVFYGGLGVFSRFYFSATIISDNKTYGTIGAIFSIMTWFIAIGAVIILGAVAGVVWEERRKALPVDDLAVLDADEPVRADADDHPDVGVGDFVVHPVPALQRPVELRARVILDLVDSAAHLQGAVLILRVRDGQRDAGLMGEVLELLAGLGVRDLDP
jgi:membrane protein